MMLNKEKVVHIIFRNTKPFGQNYRKRCDETVPDREPGVFALWKREAQKDHNRMRRSSACKRPNRSIRIRWQEVGVGAILGETTYAKNSGRYDFHGLGRNAVDRRVASRSRRPSRQWKA